MPRKLMLLAAVTTFLGSLPMFATGPSFHPDVTLTGSSLAGWHTFGQAEWRAENGEVVATPKGGGGWLVLDHPYQDIGVFTQFRCAAACETGVLLRAEKTATGMKGIYVALSDPDLPTYSVTIDAQGQIVERNKLRHGGGLVRIAPPPSNEPERQFHMPTSTAKLPFAPPDASLHLNDWNQAEILLDANIVRTFLNNGREHGAVGDEGYGAIALYAGALPDAFDPKNPAGTNLGYYLSRQDTHFTLYTLATNIDALAIWCMVLTAIGVAVVAGTKRGAGYIAVFGWWTIMLMFSVGMAAIFS